MEIFRKYQQIIGEVNYYAFLAFLAVLPYPHSFSRPIWMIWLISWVLELRFLQRPQLRKNGQFRKELIPFLGLVVWFIWNAISMLWAEDTKTASSTLMRDFDLFILFPVALWGLNERYDWQQCLKVLIVSSLLSVLVYLFVYYWVNNYASAWDRMVAPAHKIDWLNLTDFTMNIKHRLHYISPLCLAAAAVFFQQQDWRLHLGKTRTAIFSALAILLIAAGIYWTGSREGVIDLFAVLFLAFLFAFPKHKRLLWGSIAAGLAVVAMVGVLQFHPRFNKVPIKEYLTLRDDSSHPAEEPRLAIWHAALAHPEDYSLHGVGVGQGAHYLSKEYEKRHWEYYIWRNYNSHNTYLAVWIELGLAAMLLFIALWITLPFCFRGRTRRFAVYFGAIYMLNMLTEHMFGGIEGIFLCASGLILLIAIDQKQSA